MPTPVHVHRLQYHLQAINYPTHLTRYLVTGFLEGFHIGHTQPIQSTHPSNSPHVIDLKEIVSDKLTREIAAGHIAGPFSHPPFPQFHISPLNIREKKTVGKYRLLHNLSYPYDGSSINANIPDQYKRVTYSSVRDAIKHLVQLPCPSYCVKTDIADAFPIIPLHPDEYHKLGISFDGQYYYYKVLPQGCASSCQIFESFSTALHAIIQAYNPALRCVHFLDDFLLMAPTETLCNEYLSNFLHLCHDIGVPIALDKTTSPSTRTTFLGIQLDTEDQCARLPPDKIAQYTHDIQQALQHRSITYLNLQSLIGKLNFACSVVPARPFLRRLIDLLSRASKPYHFINLNHEAKADLHMWLNFLSSYNGVTYFRSLNIITSTSINMVSDASKHGFGACFGEHWIQAPYPPAWQNMHITILELYPIYVLLTMFASSLVNTNVLFYCDNQSVCHIINNQTSKDKTVLKILRPLILLLVQYNIHLRSQHLPGIQNTLCDKISRFQVTSDLLHRHHMDTQPTNVPPHLLPKNFNLA